MSGDPPMALAHSAVDDALVIRTVLLLALGACAPTLAASNTSIALDMASTWHASDSGRWDRGRYEANPILGTNPSGERLVGFGLAAIGLNTLGSALLPKWLSVPLAVVVTSVELRLAWNNEQIARDPR